MSLPPHARAAVQRILDAEARRLCDEGYRTVDGRLLSPLDFENHEGRDAVARSAMHWLALTQEATRREHERRRAGEEAA
jgi:hypothetical protein